jgi:hypothetical protein
MRYDIVLLRGFSNGATRTIPGLADLQKTIFVEQILVGTMGITNTIDENLALTHVEAASDFNHSIAFTMVNAQIHDFDTDLVTDNLFPQTHCHGVDVQSYLAIDPIMDSAILRYRSLYT